MPLKNLFRSVKRYDVSTRNAYVVCIHLLNGSLIECTLTSDSTGQECLQNIAQRINLNEMIYFGLRYVNKKLQFRWLELDKPLKRQLDKNAHSPLLYFSIMFYVPQADAIQDHMTRYQYYMQLKSDVIEGKLPCTPEQAVLLAAYSVQGEFGDFTEEKHSVEFYKEYVQLPRTMSTDEALLGEMYGEIVNTHYNLRGIDPRVAELQYIIEAQQLDGYGLEYFNAKDSAGCEVGLGVSVIGLFIKPKDEDSEKQTSYFKWSDIRKLTTSKRSLVLDTCVTSKLLVTFTLDDPDTARYVQRLCQLQRQFFEWMNSPDSASAAAASQEDAALASAATAGVAGAAASTSVLATTSAASSAAGVHRSTSTASKRLSQSGIPMSAVQASTASAKTKSTADVNAAGIPDVATSHPHTAVAQALSSQSQPDLHRRADVAELTSYNDRRPSAEVAHYDHAQLATFYQQQLQQQQHQQQQLQQQYAAAQHDGFMTSLNAAALEPVHQQQEVTSSLAALDPAQQASIQQYMEAMAQPDLMPPAGYFAGQNAVTYGSSNLQVPQYRRAPSYQEVIRQMSSGVGTVQQVPTVSQPPQQLMQTQMMSQPVKGQLAGGNEVYVAAAAAAPAPTSQAGSGLLMRSQPDVSRTPPTYAQYMQQNRQRLQYSRSVLETRPNLQHIIRGGPHYQPTGYGRPVDRTNSLNIHTTYSMPEISWRGLMNQQQSASELQLTRDAIRQPYKPPPPYPRNGSTSTPDLASQMARLNVTTSQELTTAAAAGLNLSNLNLRAQAQVNRSVENVQLVDQHARAALQLSQQQQQQHLTVAAAPDICASAEHLPQHLTAADVYDVSALQQQHSHQQQQLYSSNTNVALYINSVNSTPSQQQQFTQQQLLESGIIAQQFLNQSSLQNQPPYVPSGADTTTPSQIPGNVSHPNNDDLSQYVQYANLPALTNDKPGATQYGAMVQTPTAVTAQQYADDIAHAQFVARQQQQQQLEEQQLNGEHYNDETDSVDTAVVNQEDILVTSPLNIERVREPPRYHPLLGAHYGQPVVSSSDYFASRGLDDSVDEPAAGAGLGDVAGARLVPAEHVYQNLPSTSAPTVYEQVIYPKQRSYVSDGRDDAAVMYHRQRSYASDSDDGEDENPYENLPTALEALRIKQAAIVAQNPQLGYSDIDAMQYFDANHGHADAHTSSMPNLYRAASDSEDLSNSGGGAGPTAALSQSQLAALGDAVHMNAEQLQSIQTNPQSMIAKLLTESSSMKHLVNVGVASPGGGDTGDDDDVRAEGEGEIEEVDNGTVEIHSDTDDTFDPSQPGLQHFRARLESLDPARKRQAEETTTSKEATASPPAEASNQVVVVRTIDIDSQSTPAADRDLTTNDDSNASTLAHAQTSEATFGHTPSIPVEPAQAAGVPVAAVSSTTSLPPGPSPGSAPSQPSLPSVPRTDSSRKSYDSLFDDDLSVLHPLASTSISLPHSHTFTHAQRLHSDTAASGSTQAQNTAPCPAHDVTCVMREQRAGSGNYERLLVRSGERRRKTSRGSSGRATGNTSSTGQHLHAAAAGADDSATNRSHDVVTNESLDVNIPRPSVTSSQPSPTAAAADNVTSQQHPLAAQVM